MRGSTVRHCEEHPVATDFGRRAEGCGASVTRLLSGSVRDLCGYNAPQQSCEGLACIAVPTETLSLDA